MHNCTSYAICIKVAQLAAFCMIFLTAYQSYGTYQSWKKDRAVQKYDYSRLEKITRDMFNMISAMIQYASDGWLPSNDDEFFSERTAIIISRNLNIQTKAPVYSERNWLEWMLVEADHAHKEFNDYITVSRSSLDAELFQSLIDFNSSFFVFYPRHEMSLRKHLAKEKVQFPPILCPNDCTPSVFESLSCLRHLYGIIQGHTGTKPFPMPRKLPSLGSSRYTDEDLQKWKATTTGRQLGFSLEPRTSTPKQK